MRLARVADPFDYPSTSSISTGTTCADCRSSSARRSKWAGAGRTAIAVCRACGRTRRRSVQGRVRAGRRVNCGEVEARHVHRAPGAEDKLAESEEPGLYPDGGQGG